MTFVEISEPETRPPHAVDVMLPAGTARGKGMDRCSWGMSCICLSLFIYIYMLALIIMAIYEYV